MQIVNIYDAKTQLSKLINQALAGEEIVIAKNGQPLIQLTPVDPHNIPPRKGGQLKGILEVNDDFDEPLPADLHKQFYKD